MVHISDVLSMTELNKMIDGGRIGVQSHPYLPLRIYNYTARAQFMNVWTEAERVCRGLIVDNDGVIVARGPKKFYNYGQSGSETYPLETMVRVSNKEDGSLGIFWKYGDKSEVATRGSFTSSQAIRATQMKYETSTNHDRTAIGEIIYPENRIVLDYGNFSGVIYLGLVDNLTGMIVSRPGIEYRTMTLAEALALPVEDDKEGFVLDILDDQGLVVDHLKLKGERYKRLHGLMTNVSGRRIWTELAARACHIYIENDDQWANYLSADPKDFKRVNLNDNILETYLSNVPDEFYSWVKSQINTIESSVTSIIEDTQNVAQKVSSIPQGRERFEAVKDHPLRTEILRLTSGGSLDRVILAAWKLSKPSGNETPYKKDED